MRFICNDCKQDIYFDPLSSGSCGNKPVTSHCICVDRDDNIEKFGRLKKTRIINHIIKYPTYNKHLERLLK